MDRVKYEHKYIITVNINWMKYENNELGIQKCMSRIKNDRTMNRMSNNIMKFEQN